MGGKESNLSKARRHPLADACRFFTSSVFLPSAQAKTEIVKLEMKKASRQEFKPHEIKAQKKRVAQLLTVKREREIEQGISKRESKRAEK